MVSSVCTVYSLGSVSCSPSRSTWASCVQVCRSRNYDVIGACDVQAQAGYSSQHALCVQAMVSARSDGSAQVCGFCNRAGHNDETCTRRLAFVKANNHVFRFTHGNDGQVARPPNSPNTGRHARARPRSSAPSMPPPSTPTPTHEPAFGHDDRLILCRGSRSGGISAQVRASTSPTAARASASAVPMVSVQR